MGLAVGTTLAKGKGVHREVESEGSRRQGSRPDEQEPHIRLEWSGRVCKTKRSPTLPELHTVNAAGRWNEGYLCAEVNAVTSFLGAPSKLVAETISGKITQI